VYIEELPMEGLYNFPTFYMFPGDSLWVPWGCMAVPVGVPPVPKLDVDKLELPKDGKSKDGAVQKHKMCYSILPMYDQAGPPKDDPEFLALLASWLVRCQAILPDSYLKNKSVETWRDALKPSSAVASKVE